MFLPLYLTQRLDALFDVGQLILALCVLCTDILDQSRRGAAVLVFSEELEELIEICDRIHVLSEGRLSPSIPRAEATKARLGSYMTGAGGMH